MTDRELLQLAAKAAGVGRTVGSGSRSGRWEDIENEGGGRFVQVREAAEALRTALAAEPQKQESVESDDDEEFTREDVVTLLLEVMDWTYAQAHRNRPMTEAEQKVLNDIRTALAAEQPKPEPVAAQHRFRLALPAAHWALKIGSPDWGPWHACKVSNRPSWEIDSQGWEVEYRPLYAAPPENEALRRDAERYRWMATGDTRRRVCNILPLFNAYAYRKEHIDAVIDAAMEGKR